jgi:hypothetical protein
MCTRDYCIGLALHFQFSIALCIFISVNRESFLGSIYQYPTVFFHVDGHSFCFLFKSFSFVISRMPLCFCALTSKPVTDTVFSFYWFSHFFSFSICMFVAMFFVLVYSYFIWTHWVSPILVSCLLSLPPFRRSSQIFFLLSISVS